MSPQPLPNLAAVVAMADHRVIGHQGGLPWHLPDDLKWFKRLTSGATVIMGRKTFLSIGKPLPKRRNWILSSSGYSAEGCETFLSVEALLQAVDDENPFYLIGGAAVYRALLPWCAKVFLTQVHGSFPGDTYLDPFEAQFPVVEELFSTPEFSVLCYRRPL